MAVLESLLLSGRFVDLVLLLIAAEAVVLIVLRRQAAIGPGMKILPVSGAGASLLLALRSALTGGGWPWIAGWLFIALCFHIADIALRWRDTEPY